MKTRWLLLFGVGLAVILTLLAGQRPASGQEGEEDRNLVGTWNVTLQFPVCSPTCPCPGGIPNIPVHALQTYVRRGTIVEAPAGTLFRGPGLGSWTGEDDHDFVAHFKFFLFKPDGTPRGSEEVTDNIDVTGANTFTAAATFDLFDTAGNMLAQGCPINESATRF